MLEYQLMIKAIIADVDGVMVGKREGFNFPLPHASVIEALKNVSAKGVPVVLCTAKFHVAIDEIVEQAKLNNPHITDGGALIINPLGTQKIVQKKVISKPVIEKYLSTTDAYTELYSADSYFVQKDADKAFMAKRSKLLQTPPQLIDSLQTANQENDIIKIISYAEDSTGMPELETAAKRLGNEVNYIWSHHPFIMPRRPIVITAARASKEQAASDVMNYLGIPFEHVLGIGDSLADWSFMQRCGYVGVVGDDNELTERVKSRSDNYHIADSVDKHGFLEILDYFKL